MRQSKKKPEPFITYYDQDAKGYRATNLRFKGIAATKAAKKFTRKNPKKMRQYYIDGIYGNFNWTQLGSLARMYYDNVQDAVDILVRGSTLFKKTPRSTFLVCKIINDEIVKRSRSKRTKADPDYAGPNRVIDDNLEELCKHTPDINYKEIYPSKLSMNKDPRGKGKITKVMRLDRQPIINRFVEKYRRLVKYKKREFEEYLAAKVIR
jgi:hypothetical protein|tara:strand:+ start:1756 stop:2379 length:624 start_codon:yes stop_codon:yes gene_type:complete